MNIEIESPISEGMRILVDGETVYATTEPAEPEIPEGYLSPHFRIAEFDCNHCGEHGHDIAQDLVDVLEDVREHFGGKAVTINSGVRCPFHNSNVGGAPNSTHLSEGSVAGYPCAADIVVAEVAPSQVHAYLTGKYPNQYGIGRYNSFTHIDTRPSGPARW